ncbi:MAG: hypothetical protein HY342_04730 [Candidatus Lambdaproteobacteria bacterium]|nr:hypothetical protein [Candidatus Lambdaproteobacteria bacterium]
MALALLAVLGLLLGAGRAAAQERLLQRSLPSGETAGEPQALAPGQTAVLQQTPLRIQGATSLRIVSPDPELRVVLRFRTEAGAPAGDTGAALTLTVLVDAQLIPREYLYRAESQVIEDGALRPSRRFRLDQDLVTALEGAPGRVTRIVVQDDAAAELRLSLRESELVLEAVTPAFGGEPSGGTRPYYHGLPLRFMDAPLLGAGYTDNGYGELWIADTFGARGSVFVESNETQTLVQGLVRQPLVRWAGVGLWIEGGGAYHNLDAPTATVAQQEVVAWALGTSLHWRRGDWGAAVQLSLIKDEAFLLLEGGWQVFEHVGALLTWQSFAGYSGFGLGAGVRF